MSNKDRLTHSLDSSSDSGTLNQLIELHRFSPACVLFIDHDGILIHVNKMGLCLLEVESFEELKQTRYSEIIDHSQLAQFRQLCAKARAGGSGILEFNFKGRRGARHFHEAHISAIHSENNRVEAILCVSTDYSVRKELALALRESEHRFRMLSDSIPQHVWTATTEGVVSYINHRAADYCGLPESEILAKGWECLVYPEELAMAEKVWAHSVATGERFHIDLRLRRADGEYCWHIVQALPLYDNEGNIIEWFGSNTDISDRKVTEQKLLQTKLLLDESQRLAKVGGWELDISSNNLYWTAETYRILETTPEEFNPNSEACTSLYTPESRDTYLEAISRAINDGIDFDLELEIVTVKGRTIDIRTTCIVTMSQGQVTKLTGMFQDISDAKNIQRQAERANRGLAHANSVLEHIAHYDALTRLPNRTLLADRMQQAMKLNQRQGNSMAVAFLDLDGFKEVNDTYGHAEGDELLIALSHRMKATLRECDTLARLGGDEFVVVLSDLKHTHDCDKLLSLLLKAVAKPLELAGHTLRVSASIGVTFYPQDGVDAEQLLRHADQAMYLAKQAGKNCIHIFDFEKDAEVKSQQEELEKIKQAFYDEQFCLFYQPKVNMQTGVVIGVEALIRWRHPTKGLLSPAAFLPIIEENYFSVILGEWVIKQALTQIEEWSSTGLHLPVSVNVGALQLQQKDFVKRLEGILELFPDRCPNTLELEILETSALEDIAQVSKLITTSQELGVNFSLDDFGTGYSSLTYLKRLPAEILKIDQSFVRDMLADPDDHAIIEGIIGLAAAFGRKVIAEGVESLEHGEALLKLGCIYAQGYGIARPMPMQEIPAWVDDWHLQPKLLGKT